MRLISSMLLATALSLSGGAAFAACPDHSASNAGTDTTKTGSVTKDTSPGAAGHGQANLTSKSGSQAPLEGANQPGTHTYSQAGNDVNKNGRNTPLGTNPNQATSQQDVNAQQHGGKTAAATGLDNKDCVD